MQNLSNSMHVFFYNTSQLATFSVTRFKLRLHGEYVSKRNKHKNSTDIFRPGNVARARIFGLEALFSRLSQNVDGDVNEALASLE